MRRRGAQLAALTQDLWRGLTLAMSPEEARDLVNQWLIAKLEEDADIRDLKPGKEHFLAVFKKTEPWLPDQYVRTITRDDAIAALDRGEHPELLLRPGEDFTNNLSDADIAKRKLISSFERAGEFLITDEDIVARPLVVELFVTAGVTVDEELPGFKAAVRFMLRAQRDLLIAHIDRSKAGWRRWASDSTEAEALVDQLRGSSETATSVAPLSSPPAAPTAKAHDLLVQDAVEAYIAESVAGKVFKPGRGKEVRKAVEAFDAMVARPTTLSEVSASMAGEYRQEMAFYPENAGKRADYRDLTVHDRVRKARARSEPRLISLTTLNSNYIDPLRGLWDWAQSTGKNPPRIPSSGSRRSSPEKQLGRQSGVTILRSNNLVPSFPPPLFTGSAGEQHQRLYRPGEHRVDDWRYWLPVMALFTGARLNELCGLRLADFGVRDGVDFIHIRAVAEGQSTKTIAANRLVLVHPQLVALGLMERVGDLRRTGEERLFPNLRPGPRDYLSDQPSKFFGKLIKRMLGEDTHVVFHSFRHTFISALRRAEVPRDVRTALVGHDEADLIRGEAHDGYGEEAFGRLVKAVNAVEWRGLDLCGMRLPPTRGSSEVPKGGLKRRGLPSGLPTSSSQDLRSPGGFARRCPEDHRTCQPSIW